MPRIPHYDCPDHGDQAVTAISGDLMYVYLACGAVLTGTVGNVTVTHTEGEES